MADESTQLFPTSGSDATKLQGRYLAPTAPASGDELVWDDTLKEWRPQSEASSGAGELFTALDFTSSNLTSITTRNFSDLQNIPTTATGYGITDASTADIYIGDFFRGGDPSTDNAIDTMISLDGINFYTIYGRLKQPSYGAASGQLRDPSVTPKKINGLWWQYYTDGVLGASSHFVVASSPDRVTWTTVGNVSMLSIGSVTQTWAPEAFIDSDDSLHVIVSVSTDNTATQRLYETHPTNAAQTTWSTPVALTNLTTRMYDGFVVKVGSTYHLFFTNGSAIRRATASTLTGTYTDTGYLTQGGGLFTSESPSIVQKLDGTFALYQAGTGSNSGQFVSTASTISGTWATPQSITLNPLGSWGIAMGTVQRCDSSQFPSAILGVAIANLTGTNGILTLEQLTVSKSGSATPAKISLQNTGNDSILESYSSSGAAVHRSRNGTSTWDAGVLGDGSYYVKLSTASQNGLRINGSNLVYFDDQYSGMIKAGSGGLIQNASAGTDYLAPAAIGTTVQAYDSDLTTWAGITPGTGVGTALGVNVGSAGAFVTNGGALGTPSSGTLTNATGLPITGITSSTSAQLRTLLSDENGTGAALFDGATSPTFVTPALGTPSALVGTNITGTATSFNINGTVGATTPAAGTFTALTGTSGTLAGLTGLAIRDTSSAFDVTLAATSSTTLTAGRTLTLNMGNAAHTLALGTTAGTITFPNTAAMTVARTDAAQTFTGVQTMTSPAITTPAITTGINDANGNSMLAFTATASAVDGFTFTNAATANPATVTMAATGSDSNIHLQLTPKGTGSIICGRDGLVGTPAIRGSDTDSGIWFSGNNTRISVDGTNVFNVTGGTQRIRIASASIMAWSSTDDAAGTMDTGIYRNSAGVMEINNGNSGTYRDLKLQNIVQTAKTTTYNNISTVSNGVPSEVATIDSTGLTANVGATTLYAVPASGAGLYRVSAYLVTTTAASVSSTMPNAQVVYTDSDSNTSVTLDVSPILGAAGLGQSGLLTANAVGTVFSGTVVVYIKASTTIQYQTVNYASTAGGMAYALRMKLEAL